MASPEFVLIEALRTQIGSWGGSPMLGIGDDAAVVEIAGTPVAITVDALVDGVHFDRGVSGPADVGWKLIAVSVSDLAAIGARPEAGVVSLHLPSSVDDAWVEALYDGIGEASRRWDLDVVGGDVTASPTLALTATLVGGLEGRTPMRRSGAQPGDLLVLVGDLGRAAAGLVLHRHGRTALLEAYPDLLAWHRRPEARLDEGVALAEAGVSCCIDVSDGLGRDAAHVARASGVGLVVDEVSLPVTAGVRAAMEELGRDLLAIEGGEDFALLAAAPPPVSERLREEIADLHVVGRVEVGAGVRLVREDGRIVEVGDLGYEHHTTREDR